MKRIISIICIMYLVMLFYGCQQTSYKIQLHQPENQIAQIVIMDNTGNKGTEPRALRVIEADNEIADFLIDLQQVKCGKVYNDPSTSYGYLYIEVVYENGDIEIIGTGMLTYQTADGATSDVYDGWYYAEFDSMCALFEKYTGVTPSIPR